MHPVTRPATLRRVALRLGWPQLALPQLGTITRMAIGVASLVVMLLLVLDFAFGLVPNPANEERLRRQAAAELLAVQVTQLAARADGATLSLFLAEALPRYPGLRSLALRKEDGNVMSAAGDTTHLTQAGGPSLNGPSLNSAGTQNQAASATLLRVPIRAHSQPWGQLELAYTPLPGDGFWQVLFTPQSLWPLALFATLVALLRLYLGRMLHQLDPSTRVPERVRSAYDALSEGVLLLDREGRVVMGNAAFVALAGGAPVPAGQRATSLAFFGPGAVFEGGAAPWHMALQDGITTPAQRLTVKRGEAHLVMVVTCTPLLDERLQARGCLVVLLDRTSVERTNEELHTTLAGLKAAHEHIQTQNVELTRLATRDPLSGSLNRRAFFDAAHALQRRLAHGTRPLAVVMVDIDHFKRINDTYGHGTGDTVIRGLADTLAATVRAQDLVCRFGGEEFCVLLVDADQALAAEIAERLRSNIESGVGSSVVVGGGQLQGHGNAAGSAHTVLRVTASLGVAVGAAGVHTVEQLLDAADQMLYRSKEAGRNRVTLHPGLPALGVHGSPEKAAQAALKMASDGARASAGTSAASTTSTTPASGPG
jgi:diguanylate cyclase (GGDEF)-like protein